jgi:hypothetical protein
MGCHEGCNSIKILIKQLAFMWQWVDVDDEHNQSMARFGCSKMSNLKFHRGDECKHQNNSFYAINYASFDVCTQFREIDWLCCGMLFCGILHHSKFNQKTIKWQQITLHHKVVEVNNRRKLNLVYLVRRIETNGNQSGRFYTVRGKAALTVLSFIVISFIGDFWRIIF